MAVLAFWGVTSGFASDKKVFFLPLDGDQIGLTICNAGIPGGLQGSRRNAKKKSLIKN